MFSKCEICGVVQHVQSRAISGDIKTLKFHTIFFYFTGHDIFQSGNEMGSIRLDAAKMDSTQRQGIFNLLVYIPIACAVLQLLVWSQFTLHGRRLRWIKSMRAGSISDAV